jgi:hypothetical protein
MSCGSIFKKSSLRVAEMKKAYHHIIILPPHSKPFDIISSPEFAVANEAYKAAQSEIKRSGKGSVDHYPKIEDSDLVKLYHSVFSKYSDRITESGSNEHPPLLLQKTK